MLTKTWKFSVDGCDPGFLMNNPIGMGSSGGDGKLSTKKVYDPFTDSAKCLYRNADGTLYVPALWFRMAILYAAKGRKIGKVAAVNVISASLFMKSMQFDVLRGGKKVKDDRKSIDQAKSDWNIFSCRAVVQKNGITRSRPLIFTPWTIQGEFDYDPEMVRDESLLDELLGIAGRISGIGDYAPRHKGWFGMFETKK